MLDKKIEEALNKQLNAEFYSAYLYLSMAAYCESLNLAGFANWMKVQFQEEQFHATKFYDFIIERGAAVKLAEIQEPPHRWDSPMDIFAATLDHERMVTTLINDLVYLAREHRDNASEIFLQWFVKEQVEEESTADTILGKLKFIKDNVHALLMLDAELAQRVFTPPVA